MRKVGPSRLDEAVAAWLQAEVKSPQFSSQYVGLRDSDRHIIYYPNLDDREENSRRRQFLSYRGGILKDISGISEWFRAELSADDLRGLHASPYPSWEIYSECTGKLVKVADAIRNGFMPRVLDPQIQQGLGTIQQNVRGLYALLNDGKTIEPLILLANNNVGPFTVIEGTKRATALCWRHCLDDAPCPGVPAFVGITQGACPWVSPHSDHPST